MRKVDTGQRIPVPSFSIHGREFHRNIAENAVSHPNFLLGQDFIVVYSRS